MNASTTDGFEFIQDQPTTGTCAWEASPTGLYQSSNTWGNYPNYNTLTGCNALVNTTTFEEFIMEVEIDAVADNDGMGLGAPRRRPPLPSALESALTAAPVTSPPRPICTQSSAGTPRPTTSAPS